MHESLCVKGKHIVGCRESGVIPILLLSVQRTCGNVKLHGLVKLERKWWDFFHVLSELFCTLNEAYFCCVIKKKALLILFFLRLISYIETICIFRSCTVPKVRVPLVNKPEVFPFRKWKWCILERWNKINLHKEFLQFLWFLIQQLQKATCLWSYGFRNWNQRFFSEPPQLITRSLHGVTANLSISYGFSFLT